MRALGHIASGTYIDIGGFDPEYDSVSLAFYKRGWRGLHVEPIPALAEKFSKARPDEEVLCAAVSSKAGTIDLHRVADTGMSTSNISYADTYKAQSFEVETITVPAVPLSEVLDRFSDRPVHWLKIDVEGMEGDVVSSWAPSQVRPWIVVVEATEPNSQVSTADTFEPQLLALGYEFVYFDGLNRFYVSVAHPELKAAFGPGANFFDRFSINEYSPFAQGLVQSFREADALRAADLDGARARAEAEAQRAASFNTALAAANEEVFRLHRHIAGLDAHIATLEQHREKAKALEAHINDLNATVNALNREIEDRRREGETLKCELTGGGSALRHLYLGVRPALTPLRTMERTIRRAIRGRIPKARIQAKENESQSKSVPVPVRFEPRPTATDVHAGTVYVYVDHTAGLNINTGVQRTVRGLCSGLADIGQRARYVKWDSALECCVLISAEERANLAGWNGPKLIDADAELYLPAAQLETPLCAVPNEGDWFVIPEVTHLTSHGSLSAVQLILWARRHKAKVGAIFYDAIPMRRPEFASMAGAHEAYMRALRLTDIVWGISAWAAQDLATFWRQSEKADAQSMPRVKALSLPGASLHARATEILPSEKLILSVGTLEPRKNQLGLIRAFQAHRRAHPESGWRLTFCGHLHPLVADEVNRACAEDPAIVHLGYADEDTIADLHSRCAFTAFVSTEEGFGLPILESIWQGKPCLCANFGSMAEVADGGGCLMVDVRDPEALASAVQTLIDDADLRERLTREALARPMSRWQDYAHSLCADIKAFNDPCIYIWVESTVGFPANTGIQRVLRQFAREFINTGWRVIPVRHDHRSGGYGPASANDLQALAQWNGPAPESWSSWVPPELAGPGSWFVMTELPLNLSAADHLRLLEFGHRTGLKNMVVFYDVIPWKMREIYPAFFAESHRQYMLDLVHYDLVLPISHYSLHELRHFLTLSGALPADAISKLIAVPLPGEFPNSERVTRPVTPIRRDNLVRILCTGTIEPRKNHERMLEAFALASARSPVPLRLTLVGNGHSIEPALSERVRAFVDAHDNVEWLESADDTELERQHHTCDFSVYPSVEEGFGLPILESLWHGKPVICANFGAMAEVASDGGCIMVDVRDVEAMAQAIVTLATDTKQRARLAAEACARPFKSWQDYAQDVGTELRRAGPPEETWPSHDIPDDPGDVWSRARAMNLPARPRLSICISTYNRAEWLAVNLRNWARLYPTPLEGVELFVCDNASTDHTSEVVKPYLSRADFSYQCNPKNVGMLGNLRETAHNARGEYVWITGDDDLMMPGAIERILDAITNHPGAALVYLNYAYTKLEDARQVKDFDAFFRDAIDIVPPEPDLSGPLKTICARNENFFTAIYALVFRRDHAISAYSQDVTGRPFSNMPTCIPTTYYCLNHLMEEPAVWIGTPTIVVNMNVSWMRYATLWILERIPEVYDEAERRGVPRVEMDQWRRKTLPGYVHFFREIFGPDPEGNAAFFDPERSLSRFRHLPEFTAVEDELRGIYQQAYAAGHPAARVPPDRLFHSASNAFAAQ